MLKTINKICISRSRSTLEFKVSLFTEKTWDAPETKIVASGTGGSVKNAFLDALDSLEEVFDQDDIQDFTD